PGGIHRSARHQSQAKEDAAVALAYDNGTRRALHGPWAKSSLANARVYWVPARENDLFMHELDTCGLDCPLPLLKAKQALNRLQSGEELRVLATDPGSQRDFRVFAEQSGHALLESSEQNGLFCYVLKKR